MNFIKIRHNNITIYNNQCTYLISNTKININNFNNFNFVHCNNDYITKLNDNDLDIFIKRVKEEYKIEDTIILKNIKTSNVDNFDSVLIVLNHNERYDICYSLLNSNYINYSNMQHKELNEFKENLLSNNNYQETISILPDGATVTTWFLTNNITNICNNNNTIN